jgi:hypothetical protein
MNFKKDLLTGKQGRLINDEGRFDVSFAFRDRLSRALSSCKESRWQIAAKISELTGHEIGKHLLDKICSSNKNYALRAEDLGATIFVTQDIELAKILLVPCGLSVIGPSENKLLTLMKMNEKKNRLSIEIASLEAELLGSK